MYRPCREKALHSLVRSKVVAQRRVKLAKEAPPSATRYIHQMVILIGAPREGSILMDLWKWTPTQNLF
ncbi:hypothetical protein DPMN_046016 [Dreissena polymorpha]|uniref:Uncharacterized protein n=1 Tax=Dreissena polymorpha TaxID=45954 RepID=A0A9D4D625_DREPO|nr:hypothetical protein DPMN_046016 [Dreissena polymorpha]